MADCAVAPTTSDEVGTVATVLADAFHDDPVMGWLVPDVRRRPAAYRRFFELEAGEHALRFTDSLTATYDGRVVGAALVLPPGSWQMPLARQIRQGRAFAAIFRARLPRALVLQTEMEQHHPREPHYYLPFIGVAGVARGRGIGTELLRALTARCDADHLPAYLEATNADNARLYRRHGFESLDVLTVRDCPPLERMWRRPVSETRE